MQFKFVSILVFLSTFGLVACSNSPVDVNENWSSNTVAVSVPIGASSAIVIPASSAIAVSSPSTYYHVLPSVANATTAQNLYNQWKNVYYRTATQEIALGQDAALAPYYNAQVLGSARILWDKSDCAYEGQCTVSEGIGYGMVLAYFANDGDAFTALWKYHKYFRIGGANLMDWKVSTFYSFRGGDASATDADLDVATALLLGYQKWKVSDFLVDAQLIMGSIWDLEIDKTNLAIRPGNTLPWNDGTRNPSYFSPVAFRLFAQYDSNPAHNWAGVLENNYNWMVAMNAAGLGLFPDWANDAGAPQKPPTGVANGTYSKYYLESIRVPWRLAWDYAWYGDARAKVILDRMAAYIISVTNGDITQIQDRYVFTGAFVKSGAARQGQIASFCGVGLANASYAAWTNSCTSYLNQQSVVTFDYFNHIVMMLYVQLMNGLVVK